VVEHLTNVQKLGFDPQNHQKKKKMYKNV
jgi:hypothetical protein